MAEVDNRIVSMKFDNAQFEKGVSTSIKSIGDLNKALEFEGVSDSFDKISRAANKIDFSGAEQNANNFFDNLSIKGIAKISLISNLISDVYTKGKKLINDIFVAPRKDGFNEYELKMGSVQTIIASTGATLDEVNGYLDELNIYADKTIYSFKDMTASIGKFTNAGVKLKDAVLAIQGISNEAAVSGANTQEASRAMYNFAQALSAGYVKLIDWKSIENANMATVEFKQQLIDSAVALGTVVKEGNMYRSTTTDLNNKVSELFDSTKMFNDSLSSQWMTTEVLVKTLSAYADETTDIGKKAFAAAQEVKTFSQLMDTFKEALGSGWSQTFEIVIGDFNEAKELFTTISSLLDHIVGISAGVRNGLLQMWKDSGGRDKLVNSIKELSTNLERASDVAAKALLGKSYDKILGKNSESVDELSKSVEKYTEAEKEAARNIWYGSNIYGDGEERIKNLTEAGLNVEHVQEYVDELIKSGRTLNDEEILAKNTLEEIKDKDEEIKEELKEGKWSRAFDNLVNSAKLFVKAIGNVGGAIINVGKTILEAFGKNVEIDEMTHDVRSFARCLVQLTAKLKDITKDNEHIKIFTTTLVKILNTLWKVISTIFGFLGKALKTGSSFLMDIIKYTSDWAQSIGPNSKLYRAWEALKTIFAKAGDGVNSIRRIFKELFKVTDSGSLSNITNSLRSMKDSAKDLVEKGFGKVVEWLEKVAYTDFSNMKTGKFQKLVDWLNQSKDAIKGFLGYLYTNIKEGTLFDNIKAYVNDLFEDNAVIKTAGEWVSKIAGAIKKGLSEISFEDLIEALKIGIFIWSTKKTIDAIHGLGKVVVDTKATLLGPVKALSKVLNTYADNIKYASFEKVAKGVGIMASSLILVSQVPADQLYAAATAMTTVLFALSLVIRAMGTLQKEKNEKSDADVIGKKIKALGVSIQKGLSAYKLAANLAAISLLMLTMVKAMQSIVEIYKSGNLEVALIGVTSLVGLITGMTIIISQAGGKIEHSAKTILTMGASLWLMAEAVKVLAKLDPNHVGGAVFGVITMVGALTAACVVLSKYGKGASIAGAAAGMILLGIALNTLIIPIAIISTLSKALGAGYVALAVGSLVVMLGALVGLAILLNKSKAASALLIMAASLAIIGTTLMAVGIGIVPAITGIIGLAGAIVVLAGAGLVLGIFSNLLMSGVAVMMSFATFTYVLAKAIMVGSTALSLLALTLPLLGNAIVTFATTINEGSDTIIQSVKKMIEGIAGVIAGAAGMIGYAFAAIIAGIISGLVSLLPTIFDSLEQSFYTLLDFLGKLIRPFTIWIISALVKVVDGVANAIADTSSAFAAALINLIRSIILVILEIIKELTRGWNNKVGDFIGGMIDEAKDDIQKQMQEASKEANDTLEKVGKSGATALTDGAKKGVDENNPADVYSKAITDGAKSIDPSAITDKFSKGFDTEDLFSQMGFDNMDAYVEGSTDGFNLSAFGDFSAAGAEGLSAEDLYAQMGLDNSNAYVDEMENFHPQTKAEGAEMSEAGADGAKSNEWRYWRAGANAAEGFIAAIHRHKQNAYDSGYSLADEANRGLTERLDEHSPSRVMFDNGKNLVMGLINGIAKFASGAEQTTGEMGDGVLNSFMSPLQKIVDLVNGTLEYDPTIRPVLDTSQLMTDVNNVNSMFGSRSINLAGRNSQLNMVGKDLTFNTGNQNQNQDVVNAIGELRNDFNVMSDKLDNMQVVMDSGALVGAIAGPMDTALGRRQIYKGRRN